VSVSVSPFFIPSSVSFLEVSSCCPSRVTLTEEGEIRFAAQNLRRRAESLCPGKVSISVVENLEKQIEKKRVWRFERVRNCYLDLFTHDIIQSVGEWERRE